MEKYNWDLTKIFKDEKEYLDTLNTIKNNIKEIINYKGKILSNSDNLFSLLELDSETDKLITKVYVYSYLSYYSNTANSKYQEYKEQANDIYNSYASCTSFITPEIQSVSLDEINKMIDSDNRLLKYRFMILEIFRLKKHILSEKEESLIKNISSVLNTSDEAYTALNNTDIVLSNIKDENNNSVKLTASNYSKYIKSSNERVRKDAFDSMISFYKNHINTISQLYIGSVKKDCKISEIRKYNSTLEAGLYGDNISTNLYNTLIKVTDNNLNLIKEYYDIKSRVLKRKLHMYDTYYNIASCDEKNISYEEGVELSNKALEVLGSDYIDKFNYLINNNCVDVFPKDNKRSGAYEWGCYECNPYVSLNYENNVDSVSTLIHEMGHAMHTYYSNKNQEYIYANYPIFLAEIASTVNEILLSEYMFNNTNSIDDKIYYLVEFLDKFKATVYRQVMFAEFESIIHDKCDKNEPLTKEILCDTYYKLNVKHFSPSVIVDDDIKYEWARIPHFYNSFYVYKYATGFISALVIAEKLINKEPGFKEKYIEFLSSGSSDYPLELLKKLGIDLTLESTINDGFKVFEDKVNLLKKYMNEKGV